MTVYKTGAGPSHRGVSIDTNAPPPTRLSEALGPLTIPDYRSMLIAAVTLSIGMWVQLPTMGWVALELTDSPFKVSLTNVAWFFPFFILAIPSGVMADRLDRKRIMFLTRAACAGVAVVMALLSLSDRMTYTWLILLTMTIGTTIILELPSRLSLIARIVPQNQMVNAMAMVSSQMSFAQVLGPLVAGVFLARELSGINFAIFALANLSFALLVLKVRTPGKSADISNEHPLHELMDGLRYVFRHREARGMVLLPILTGSAGWVYMALMPVVTKDVLQGGPRVLGLLSAGVGLGAIPGTLFLAFYRNLPHQGRFYIGSLIIWAIGIMLFAYSPWVPVSFAILAIVGMANTAQFVLAMGIVLRVVEPAYHGRVMGTMNLTWGANIIGTLTAGMIAETLGVSIAVAASGAFILLSMVAIVATHPRIVRL